MEGVMPACIYVKLDRKANVNSLFLILLFIVTQHKSDKRSQRCELAGRYLPTDRGQRHMHVHKGHVGVTPPPPQIRKIRKVLNYPGSRN